MGTDSIAPLLYDLLRWLRARRVLEIGMGYTTPFLAQALRDNTLDFYRERQMLARKHNELAKTQKSSQQLDAASQFTPIEIIEEKSWLKENLPLLRSVYYQEQFEAKLHAVDNLSSFQSSASRVVEVVEQLDLLSIVNIHIGDYHKVRSNFDSNAEPFDFIWVDCDQSIFIFDDYWNLVNPQGGLFAVHSLLNDKGGDAVLRYFIDTVAALTGTIEIMNLVEPHKSHQSGVTILRRLG